MRWNQETHVFLSERNIRADNLPKRVFVWPYLPWKYRDRASFHPGPGKRHEFMPPARQLWMLTVSRRKTAKQRSSVWTH